MRRILLLGSLPSRELFRQAEDLEVELQCISPDGDREGDWVEQVQASIQQDLGVLLYPSEALLDSVALRDAIEAIPQPVVLVWQGHATLALSLLGAVCQGVIAGFGAAGLPVALVALLEKIQEGGKV